MVVKHVLVVTVVCVSLRVVLSHMVVKHEAVNVNVNVSLRVVLSHMVVKLSLCLPLFF